MHIVHLYKDYAPVLGGIEAHVQTLAQGLVRLGFTITVVVCQPRGGVLASDEMMHGVRVMRLPRHIDVASNAGLLLSYVPSRSSIQTSCICKCHGLRVIWLHCCCHIFP